MYGFPPRGFFPCLRNHRGSCFFPCVAAVTNISTYRFTELSGLRELRGELLGLCAENELKGTILLAEEGINLFVAGSAGAIDVLLARLRGISGLEDLAPKISLSEDQPFNRMLVRIKKEIISFGVDGVSPAKHTSPKLAPRELKKWLDEGRRVTLLDTRNDYEVKLGTFRGAIDPEIQTFRGFPDAVKKLPEHLKSEPVVMFCTGGIRCEKAGPFMELEGFREIYQLDGGILKYFEECGADHYEGDCFVFDQRVGVDPALRETGHAVCHACLAPLDSTDQEDPRYVPGESCPYCHKSAPEKMAARISDLEECLRRATTPLPGAESQETRRPIHIPAALHKSTLIEALRALHPQVPEEEWRARMTGNRLVSYGGNPRHAQHVVHAGERILHIVPPAAEPDVSTEIRVLFMDESLLVIHKPAPLPMHSGGRFHRNTLQNFLDLALHPRVPRAVHRLDANTTGVVVFARTRHFAKMLQREFVEHRVEKTYLAKISAWPEDDEFSCDLPISSGPEVGGRRQIDESGDDARTDFLVLERFSDGTALLEARPITGRTNQIRLHLSHLGFPIVGDPVYGGAGGKPGVHTLSTADARMCLHAWRITLAHPLTKERMTFEAEFAGW